MSGSWPVAILFALGAFVALAHQQTSAVTTAPTTPTTASVAVTIWAMVVQGLTVGAVGWVVVSVPIAFVQAYREQLRKSRVTLTKLALEQQRNTPNIKGAVAGPIYFPLPQVNSLALVLPITLRNPHPAAPSALNRWAVSLTVQGKEDFYTPDHLSGEIALPTSTGMFRLGPDDDITGKSTTAIQPGEILDGYLAVLIRGRTAAEINGGTISAHFMDVCEKPHRIDIIADTVNLNPTFGVLAGTSARFELSQASLREMFALPAPSTPSEVAPKIRLPWTTVVTSKVRWIASRLSSRKSSR